MIKATLRYNYYEIRFAEGIMSSASFLFTYRLPGPIFLVTVIIRYDIFINDNLTLPFKHAYHEIGHAF